MNEEDGHRWIEIDAMWSQYFRACDGVPWFEAMTLPDLVSCLKEADKQHGAQDDDSQTKYAWD